MSETPRGRRSQPTRDAANAPRLAELYDDAMRRHSRRTVFRVGALGAAALATGGVLAPAAAAGPTVLLNADTVAGSALRPFGRHLAFGADAARSVVVSWQTPARVTAPYLRFGTSPGEFGTAVPAEVRALTSDLAWQKPDHTFSPHLGKAVTQYYHHVRLDDLLPNTTYYYLVGHQGYDPATSGRIGELATFRTAPTPAGGGAFAFTAFGDQGVNYNALATNSLIADLAPQFHLAMGDMSYALNGEGGHPAEDIYDARKWDSFFAQNEPIAAEIPWMVALGNHEMEGWYDNFGYGGMRARFSMPDNAWAGSTCIYSWRYQNVGLISLDGNDICYNSPSNLNYTEGKQLRWLEAQLARFRADPTIDFIVVYCHQCTYSTSDSNGAELGAQQKWAPLFDRYQVDLILNGHNHVYERTDPIRGNKGTRTAPIRSTVNPVKDGTTYITAGGGGESVNKWTDRGIDDSYLGHVRDATATMRLDQQDGPTELIKVNWSRVRYRGYSLVSGEVTPAANGNPAQLRIRALTETGVLVDEITLRRS
ncbi:MULTISPECIES: metallophosphoesterase family protein [unclassified Crossiella]|uniref:purple acid phosphatase family protein n=1 Tax=unclassified Crossiella TaxID=2620835 RepID=UPI001FFEC4EF|nr:MULTISPECIES: metallophosphoesterase family protein [unclassified Crossiella]MCK2244453.1 metallophosphoesterase family protein [Crossiella sp. S99.2]MCK2258084.1 metallophosphoesterase family protein [Crossiella sp. S99.1]